MEEYVVGATVGHWMECFRVIDNVFTKVVQIQQLHMDLIWFCCSFEGMWTLKHCISLYISCRYFCSICFRYCLSRTCSSCIWFSDVGMRKDFVEKQASIVNPQIFELTLCWTSTKLGDMLRISLWCTNQSHAKFLWKPSI